MKKSLSWCLAVVLVLGMAMTAYATKSGDRAPAFTLPDTSGHSVELASYEGKVVFVDFWAHWCAPCKKELPVLDKLAKRYAPKGVVFLAINVDNDKKDALAFLSSVGISSLSVLLDPKGEVVGKYAPKAMPSSFVIDQHGAIRFVNAGYVAGDEKKFAQQLDELLR
jgi:thiol-disulfide isomerase/thioredoxin